MELSHPISVLRSLKNILTPEEFQKGVADDLLALAKQTPYSSSLIDIISSFEESKTSYMNHLKQQAGSYTFVVANEFAATIPRLDEDLDKLTTTQNAFDILLGVIDAASNNAHSSQALVSSKFNQVPCLKNKARNYLNENAEEAEKSIQEILNQAIDIEQFKVTYLEKQTPQEQ